MISLNTKCNKIKMTTTNMRQVAIWISLCKVKLNFKKIKNINKKIKNKEIVSERFQAFKAEHFGTFKTITVNVDQLLCGIWHFDLVLPGLLID